MAIQILPSGYEGLAQTLASLGETIGTMQWGPEMVAAQRRRETLANPELVTQLALAREVNPNLDLSSFGFRRPEDIAMFEAGAQAFAPTAEQRAARMDTPERAAELVAAQREETRARVPIAKAATAQAGQIESEATVAKGIADQLQANGYVQAAARARQLEANFSGDELEFRQRSLARMGAHYEQLPQHFKMMFDAALNNPGFAAHVQFHEELDALMARLRAQMATEKALHPLDLAKFQLQMRRDINDAVDRGAAANQLKGVARENAQNAALQDINALVQTYRGLFPRHPVLVTGMVPDGIFAGLGWSDRKNLVIRMTENQTPVDVAVSALLTGNQTFDGLQRDGAFRQKYGISDEMMGLIENGYNNLAPALGRNRVTRTAEGYMEIQGTANPEIERERLGAETGSAARGPGGAAVTAGRRAQQFIERLPHPATVGRTREGTR